VHRRGAALSVVVCAVGSGVGSAVGSGPDPSICCEAAARSSVSSLGSARDKVAERGDLSARTGRRVGGAAFAALASRLTERDRLVALACYELAMNRLQPLDLVGLVSPNCCQRK
jgi:hypothetical protein